MESVMYKKWDISSGWLVSLYFMTLIHLTLTFPYSSEIETTFNCSHSHKVSQ